MIDIIKEDFLKQTRVLKERKFVRIENKIISEIKNMVIIDKCVKILVNLETISDEQGLFKSYYSDADHSKLWIFMFLWYFKVLFLKAFHLF